MGFFLLSKEKIDILKHIKIKILKTYTKHTNIKEIHPKKQTFTWGNHDHDWQYGESCILNWGYWWLTAWSNNCIPGICLIMEKVVIYGSYLMQSTVAIYFPLDLNCTLKSSIASFHFNKDWSAEQFYTHPVNSRCTYFAVLTNPS